MIDIHDAHHAADSWREFFVHIATIVLGLLIAIGLEQTVEYFHHRNEVAETRELLHIEHDYNLKSFAVDTASFRLSAETMKNNLLVLKYLKQHPGTPEEKLPGDLLWGAYTGIIVDSAWKMAQQTNVTQLMNREEVAKLSLTYSKLDSAGGVANEYWRAVNRASHYFYLDPDPSHMTPAQIDEEIGLVQVCMETNFRFGIELENLHQMFPEFSPAPSLQELDTIVGSRRSDADYKKITDARALTDARLAATRDALTAAQKVAEGAVHLK